MLCKARTESIELQILRSLNSRMALSVKEKQHYFNLKKGYDGELMFDALTERGCRGFTNHSRYINYCTQHRLQIMLEIINKAVNRKFLFTALFVTFQRCLFIINLAITNFIFFFDFFNFFACSGINHNIQPKQ